MVIGFENRFDVGCGVIDESLSPRADARSDGYPWGPFFQSDSSARPMNFGLTGCLDTIDSSCTDPRGDEGGVPLLGSEDEQSFRETIVASTMLLFSSNDVANDAWKTTSYLRVICADLRILSTVGSDVKSVVSPTT